MKTLVFLLLLSLAITLPAQAKQYEITLLNIATFEGTGWTQEKIQNQLEAVNGIFAQCNVRLGGVKIHKIKEYQPPAEMDGRRHSAPNGAIAIRTKTAQVPQPAIYLMGKIVGGGAFTKAVMRVNAPPCEPELVNSIWLPEEINSPAYQEGRNTRPFATLAHELTHLLTLDGMHNGEKPYNQLAIWKHRTDLLTSEMCAQMYESPFVREVKNTK